MLQSIIDLVSEIICVFDSQYQIKSANKNLLQIIGYSNDELETINLLSITDNHFDREHIKQLKNDEVWHTQFALVAKNKTLHHIKAKIAPQDQNFLLIATIQIFQEAPLARFRRFFDLSLLDLVMMLDNKNNIIYTNKGFTDSLGYLWDDINNQPLLQLVIKDDQESFDKFLNHLRVQEGTMQKIIIRFMMKNPPEQYKYFALRAIFNKDCVYLIANDVTENRKQEIQIKALYEETNALNQQLEHKNEVLSNSKSELEKTLHELETRNFELDQFVYKTSHDLRAPLTSILGLVNLVKIDLNDTRLVSEYADRIEKSVLRLDSFIRSLIDYARGRRGELSTDTIDFNKIIQESLESLRYTTGFDRIEKRINIAEEIYFQTDLVRLQIIFNNIISNAIKYQNRKQSQSFISIDIIQLPHETIQITIRDNGIGIDEKAKIQVFNMFYRGTELSTGSGLGLYIVKQTVEKLKGTIELYSEEGEGTQIDILLPNLKTN
ncbi:MAG: PAS domain S-box protein [Cytophagales bacterium]|nr:MAG: PAS domain S-box protein [Cytophagales bacterium]